MTDAAQEIKFSELETLEFNRRCDVAYAVIPAAVRLFSEEAELEKRIEIESKEAHSWTGIGIWYWIFIVGGLVLHYFLAASRWDFNIGTGITLLALGSWYAKKSGVEKLLEQLRSQRDKCFERLSELEVIWRGATAYDNFGEIRRFASEFGFDGKDENFCNWWTEQRERILERVCGWKKGRRIAENETRRSSKFMEALRAISPHD